MPTFKKQHPHYEFLRKKWIQKHKSTADKLLSAHGDYLRHLTLGGIGSLMVLSSPASPALHLPEHIDFSHQRSEKDLTQVKEDASSLTDQLSEIVPQENRKLSPEEESKIADVLSKQFHMEVSPELEGIRLNRSYGLIGGEQHLYRYPGDTVYKHAENSTEWAMYGGAGIAPGLGAWGYFAQSESQLTEEDKQREKYYLAVQTFLAPGFSENVARYRDFFKYRKMLVVNPKTGQAVVAVIGDAGPAEWTGKSLGGSPEVMHHVGYAKGPRKGAVLYFFINDPDNKIPLGPVSPGNKPFLAKLMN